MKKLLFICDTNNFPSGAFQFIKSLHESEFFLLTGAFFHSVSYDALRPVSYPAGAELFAFTDQDDSAVETSIQQFKQKCRQFEIEYRVHEESDHFEIRDVVKESRFADLVILSEEIFFSHIDKEQPNSYMQQVMHRSECPVLVVPENYNPFNSITVAYDGKKQSMFALKQFCYLFPEYTKLPVTILYLQEDDAENEIPDLAYPEEYAARHFSSLNIQKINLENKDYFSEWLAKRQDTLLITGSYSHAGILTAITESFIERTIHQHKVPVFIAHNA